jgi:DNA-binding transcriptional LysR family regulator
VLEALTENKIQLALIEGPEQRKDLQLEPFMEDHMVLVVPAGHEWAGEEVTPAMISQGPLLMREFGSGSRRVLEQAFDRSGIKAKDLHISMEFDSTEALLSAVEAGLGVTFVSRWAVRNQLALGTLQLAHARDLQLSRWFSVARPSGPEPTGNVGVFRAQLLSLKMQSQPISGRADLRRKKL